VNIRLGILDFFLLATALLRTGQASYLAP